MNESSTNPKTMKSVAIDRWGGVHELKPHTLAVPEVGPDEVLVRVEVAGVGQWDPVEREGGFVEYYDFKPAFPFVLGSDGAGTVAAVGEDVRRFKPGDRVYVFTLMNPKGGSYAEYAAVRADLVSHIPGHLTMEQAGAMPVDAMTALRGLDDTLRLKPGESILIFGASGGIGHLAVQLARRIGARVFAAASGDDGVALCERLGADAVVDGHGEDVAAAARRFAPKGLDAALLTAGGPAADQALTAMRPGSRVAYPNGVEPTPKPPAGVKAEAYDGTPDREAIVRLNGLIALPGHEPFAVHVARSFPLDHAADAQRALDQHYVGKLALQTA